MIKTHNCNHLRIRDSNAYGADVEEFIKSIEKQFSIDFRSLPQWKELVKRLHAMTTDYKRKIQDAKQRKHYMMSKIFVESTRESPFALTEKLARTRNKWQMIESSIKFKKRITLKSDPYIVISSQDSEEIIDEITMNTSTAHHNTEIPDLLLGRPSESDTEMDTKATDTSVSHLPVKICINPHKRISPLDSSEVIFDRKPTLSPSQIESEDVKEWLLLNQTKSVKCFPEELIITKHSLKEQTLKFSVINCTTEYMFIRFMCLTDKYPFKTAIIVPVTPKKIFPGIAITYKFTFKLDHNLEEFTTALYFRVGQKIFEEAPVEALCVPIISKFKFSRSVLVSKAVYTPSVYLWQIGQAAGFPRGTLTITSNDPYSYHVRIVKRLINISRECQDSLISVDVISPNTDSLIDRIEDNEIETQNKVLTSVRDTQTEQVVIIKSADIIALVVDDLLDLALDTFVFDHTYICLNPGTKSLINVYFTKPERIGSHHCYYDVEMYDKYSEELIMTKTVKVFAEILPHPIKIHPKILDMSLSPVRFGYCEDHIGIYNTHNVYPITIQIKLTTKMRKLFCVTPMETLVPAKSSMTFKVHVCSKDLSNKTDDLVHFTFKIIILGHKSVYENVPPIFYEIIAPCASEFKKIYNEKYYTEMHD